MIGNGRNRHHISTPSMTFRCSYRGHLVVFLFVFFMANSFDDALCVNGYGVDFGQIICDPFHVIDKESIIGIAAGLLVATSPIGGLVGRAVGGAVVGMAAAKMAKKYFNKDTE